MGNRWQVPLRADTSDADRPSNSRSHAPSRTRSSSASTPRTWRLTRRSDSSERARPPSTRSTAHSRTEVSQRDNPLRRKQAAKREAAEQGSSSLSLLASHDADRCTAAELAAKLGDAAPPLVTRRVIQSIDEYLAPNKILFIQNLADEMDKDGLERLFRVCVSRPPCRLVLPPAPRSSWIEN